MSAFYVQELSEARIDSHILDWLTYGLPPRQHKLTKKLANWRRTIVMLSSRVCRNDNWVRNPYYRWSWEKSRYPELYKLSMRHDVHKKLTMISLSRICAPISPLRSSAVLLMSTLKVSVGYNHSSQNLRQWTTVWYICFLYEQSL